ncbi:MAG TPA: cation:proton antiporter [Mycobacterium sp.]|jgi:NhaP-type Na+/H+ or K+/H+ antiporter|nr:cation:proton antiporter [Mycobacterium sp.]
MNTTAFVLTVLVLCYAVISGLVKRWYVAPALIFVLLGMALGPFGFGVIDVGNDVGNFTLPAELALTVILFNQASTLDLVAVVRRRDVTFRLLAIGIPLSLVLGTVTAVLLMPAMPLWEAISVAALVAPAEVALIDALLEDPRVPERIRHALSTESGFYDGFALTALVAALAVASEQAEPHPGLGALFWFLFRTEVMSLVVGLVLGAIGGVVIAWSRQRGWMSDTWAQLSTLAGALLCFQVGERLDGSGLVTAFAGGLAFAFAAKRAGGRPDTHVSDAAGHLLELAIFAMFGAYAVIAGWRDAEWRVVVFAVVAVFGVRLVAVSVALIRSDLSASNRLFIGWFGPRGLGTMVLGLLMIEHGETELEGWITQVVAVTITLSLVVHSLTVWPGINWLAAREPSASPAQTPP